MFRPLQVLLQELYQVYIKPLYKQHYCICVLYRFDMLPEDDYHEVEMSMIFEYVFVF
jgi:hypothetical protein